MSGFSAFEAKVIVKAPLPFFWGELFDVNGIYIYSIVVFFLGMFLGVVVPVILEGEEWVSLSFSNFIDLFPIVF